jgi:large subunit ribosomal protein L24
MTKNKSHVKIGDKIKVISGNQKGVIGTITTLLPKTSVAFIDTISPRLKYLKKPQEGESKKIELQIPIHISNIMLWENAKNNCSRIGYKILNQEKKRYFKKSGNFVEQEK